MLARLNRCAEDVLIPALVVAKLKLPDIEREILLSDSVERQDTLLRSYLLSCAFKEK